MATSNNLALITGASSGIGREMAGLLAERNHDLVLVSRSGNKLEELAIEIEKQHKVTVHSFAIDLAERGSANQVFSFIQEKGRDVDVLINNAGVGLLEKHTEIDIDELGKMLQLNIVTVCDLCRLFGKEMKRRKRGRILNIASTAAYQPTPFFAAYGASKSFILNFSEALAKELEDYGVTVSCLSPGPTDTGFFTAIDKRGVKNGHFSKDSRHNVKTVAAIGIDMMFKGRLSRIVGVKNYLMAFSNRFAPRTMVASVAKNMMKLD